MSYLGYGGPASNTQPMSYPDIPSQGASARSYPDYSVPSQPFAGQATPFGSMNGAFQNRSSGPVYDIEGSSYGSGYLNGNLSQNLPLSDYRSERPLTNQGLGYKGRYDSGGINWNPAANDPFVSQSAGGFNSYRQKGTETNQYQNPIKKSFSDWKSTYAIPEGVRKDNPVFKDDVVKERTINNFDDLNYAIQNFSLEELIKAGAEKYQTFSGAAQNISNAFANEDFAKRAKERQSIGLGDIRYGAYPNIDPSVEYNQQNAMNWLQNSYGMLQQRLNENYLL